MRHAIFFWPALILIIIIAIIVIIVIMKTKWISLMCRACAKLNVTTTKKWRKKWMFMACRTGRAVFATIWGRLLFFWATRADSFLLWQTMFLGRALMCSFLGLCVCVQCNLVLLHFVVGQFYPRLHLGATCAKFLFFTLKLGCDFQVTWTLHAPMQLL